MAEEFEGRLTKALNEAYVRGAPEALTGVDPKVQKRGENDG